MHWRRMLCSAVATGTLLLSGASLQAETLQEAIDEVIKTHPEVRSGAYNRLGRDEEVKQARAGYLPTLNFSAGYGIQELQEPEEDTLNPAVYTLSLRQNLFTGFATMDEVKRQKSRVRSSAYLLQAQTDLLALQTARAYLKVLQEQELLKLAEESLETHLKIADQIQMRTDAGVSSTADSDQVAGRVSLARANVVVAKTNLADAKTNYLALVGRLPDHLQSPPALVELLPQSLEEAEEQAIKAHPTLKSAYADLDARVSQYEVAKAPYYPIVDLEVDQHWEDELDDEGRNDRLIAMLRLRFNLFNGLKDEARRAETAHLISEAREIRNGTHREVIESIRLSWMARQAILDRLDYVRQRVDSASATAEAYTRQFNLGQRTLLDVLDTEAEVIDAKQDLVEATYADYLTQYRILNGLGRLVPAFGLEYPEESVVENQERDDQESIARNG